jgi:uncharacterized FAD-dependent dehydrogenase
MAKNLTFQVPPNPTGVYSIPVGVGGGGGTSMGDLNRMPPHMIQDIVDHTITGQTIFAEYILPPNYLGMTESEIKGLLIEKLVHEMYSQKNIEFTQMKRMETDEMVYRARIHVVPDTQVRVIRELKDARKTT